MNILDAPVNPDKLETRKPSCRSGGSLEIYLVICQIYELAG